MRALGYVHNSQVTEDIVQEVFIRFWDNRKKLDISLSVAAYLTCSVVNSCKNYLEHMSVQHRYEQELQSVSSEEEELQEFEEEELELLRGRLQVFIDSLPEKCREIFFDFLFIFSLFFSPCFGVYLSLSNDERVKSHDERWGVKLEGALQGSENLPALRKNDNCYNSRRP